MSFLKYFTLSYVIVFLLGVSCAVAMPGGNDEEEQSPRSSGESVTHTTPERAAAAAVVEETPGQFLSRRQARILQREAFEKIVGTAKVAEWSLDWEAFQDASSPYTSEKLLNLHRLCQAMRKVVPEYQTNDEFQDLYGLLFGIKDQVEAIHLKRLKSVVGRYFSGVYPGCEINFETKDLGVQLGTVAKIKDGEGRDHTFYVKTHSEGKLTSKSSAAKIVDPSELFVYKILERLGLGCEVHFCARSPEDVYIATRDAAEGRPFFLFKQALEDEENLGNSLWGRLSALDSCPWKDDRAAVESRIDEDPVGRQFVQQIVTLDVASRLFKLHDLLNNPDNFGFFRGQEGGLVARILDFRLPEAKERYFDFEHFGGFLEGNGHFQYASAHKTLCFILRERFQKQRVKTALSILTEGSLSGLEEVIDTAYDSVIRYLQEAGVFGVHLDKLMRDLTVHRETLQKDYKYFIERLKKWSPGERPDIA